MVIEIGGREFVFGFGFVIIVWGLLKSRILFFFLILYSYRMILIYVVIFILFFIIIKLMDVYKKNLERNRSIRDFIFLD